MMTRWFQFGTFVPLFRSHGEFPYREIYNTAPDNHPAYQALVATDRLRYRLLPYIYSLAGQTYLNDYTIMRGLAMDFPGDPAVNDIGDQYMFGPSLLINPVTEYKARSREVYLPGPYGWYDLSTGKYFTGGKVITADAPYSSIPVFAREGAILPIGPDLQFTSEKPADPITLFVFTGMDGTFTLYEDEGVNNNYEEGAYTLIPFVYSEADRTLTAGARMGEFSGMLQERTFNVVVVSKEKTVTPDFNGTPDKVITYTGEEISVKL
jgi:alpha-D-xyloside xylohydrolase